MWCDQPQRSQVKPGRSRSSGIVGAIVVVTFGVSSQEQPSEARKSRSNAIVGAIVTVTFGVSNQEEPSGPRRKQQQWHC